MTKYFKYLLLLVLPLVFVSCGGDDDEDEPNNPNQVDSRLIGTWTGEDYGDFYTVTFNKNGTCVEEVEFDDVWDSCHGTYTYRDGKITSWEFIDGSYLYNILGDCPWKVEFKSNNKIVLAGYLTLTKK